MSDFDKWYTENGYYHDTVSDRKKLMREAWNAAIATKREISNRETRIIDALRDCASVLDHMMGDSDLPEDDSFQFKACRKAYDLLNEIEDQS